MLCNFTMIDRVSSIRIRSDAIEKKNMFGSELPFLVEVNILRIFGD